MDKSLGTNCNLWPFFTRAKQIHVHLFSPSPLSHPTMLDTCTRYFSRVSTLYWGVEGGATHFKTDNSAFLKLRFKNTENWCNYTSVPRNFVHHCTSSGKNNFLELGDGKWPWVVTRKQIFRVAQQLAMTILRSVVRIYCSANSRGSLIKTSLSQEMPVTSRLAILNWVQSVANSSNTFPENFFVQNNLIYRRL